MINRRKVDTVLIGTGQGGVPLATKLAKDGQQVVVFERGPWGGTCLNYGCTPSKMLLASAHAANNARQAAKLGVHAEVDIDFPAVMERIRATSQSWSGGVANRLEDAGATLIQAEASFAAPKVITGSDHVIEADTIIINTGKSPFIPPIQGLGGTPYLTYQTIWDIEKLPKRMVIIGAGYVGIELGQAFAQLGSEVHIIASHERPLSREEPEVGQFVTEQLEEDGVRFYFKNRAEEVHYDDGVFRIGIPGSKPVEGEALLIATGRKSNTINLNPSQGNVKLDQDGHIQVDEKFQTTAEGVYAIGDVTGQPAFTHVSWEDHRRLLAILDGQDRTRMDRVLGYTIFTQPQIGRAGFSLRQAQKEGYNARQVTLPLENVARATEVGATRGFYQMLIDADTDKILGATLVSPSAGELIHIFIVSWKPVPPGRCSRVPFIFTPHLLKDYPA